MKIHLIRCLGEGSEPCSGSPAKLAAEWEPMLVSYLLILFRSISTVFRNGLSASVEYIPGPKQKLIFNVMIFIPEVKTLGQGTIRRLEP